MNDLMNLFIRFWVLLPLAFGQSEQEKAKFYSNEWVIRVEGGQEMAQMISAELGYKFLGKVN